MVSPPPTPPHPPFGLSAGYIYVYCLYDNIRIAGHKSCGAPDAAHFECCGTLRPVARCTVCFCSGNNVCAHGCSGRFWGAWRTTLKRPCPKRRSSSLVYHPRSTFRPAPLFPLRTLPETSSYCLVCCLTLAIGSQCLLTIRTIAGSPT